VLEEEGHEEREGRKRTMSDLEEIDLWNLADMNQAFRRESIFFQ